MTAMTKAELRAVLRQRAASFAPEDRIAWSREICDRLSGLPELARASRVLSFWPLPEEVDLRPLHVHLASRGATLCLPRVDWATRTIEPVSTNPTGRDLIETRYGLRQPPEGVPATPLGEIEAILAPGVGYDPHGGRLGRGAGFYDRLLARVRSGAGVVGVCFDGQIVPELPIEPHDVRVAVIVTERRIIRP